MSDLAVSRYPSTSRAWVMVALLYVGYVLSFVDRQIIAYLVAPIRHTMNISDFQLSMITGPAFAVFFVVFGIPLGQLADRVSRVRIISACIALWSITTMACGYAGTFWQLFLARVGVGVGEASLTPSGVSLISDTFPRERRHVAINIFASGVHGGLGLSNILGGVVVAALTTAGARGLLDALGGLEPWQATFVVVGAPGVIVAALFLFLREPERQERDVAAHEGVPLRETLRFMGRHARIYVTLIVGSAFGALASYAMYGWVPALFMRKYGWHAAEVGTSFGLITLVFGTSGLVLSGLIAGRLNKVGDHAAQMKMLILAILATAVVSPFLIVVNSPVWTLGCLAIVVFFLGAPIGLSPAALQAITPNEMRAQIVAVYVAVVGIVGLAGGPPAVAAITDFVFKSDAAVGSSLAIAMSLAGALGAIVLWFGLKAYSDRAALYEPGAAPATDPIETIEP